MGESVADWERTLEGVLALEPPHVSAYALTVEAGTPLALDTTRHPDDDVEQVEHCCLPRPTVGIAALGSH